MKFSTVPRAASLPAECSRTNPIEKQTHSGVLRGDHTVGINNEFLGRTSVEILVALRRIIEIDRRHIHRLGDLYLVMENGTA